MRSSPQNIDHNQHPLQEKFPDFYQSPTAQPPTVDDSHARWQTPTSPVNVTWQYYDTVVVPQIVSEALKRPDITLVSLYHALSVARYKCEWIKQFWNPVTTEEVIYYSTCETGNTSFNDGYYKCLDFGSFHRVRSLEPDIYNWGAIISKLVKERLGDNPSRPRRIGLSEYYPEYHGSERCLVHPSGDVLERLEPDFIRLRQTDNMFDFFLIVARMMYELSNYYPLSRGSSAVNTWFIQSIFAQKFNITMNVRPMLADWFAFFETPEMYTSYYMISCAFAFLKTLPGIENETARLKDNLFDMLVLDPVIFTNAEKRNDVLADIRSFCNEALYLYQKPFSYEQKRHLFEIANGSLLVTGASGFVTEYVKGVLDGRHTFTDKLLTKAESNYMRDLLALDERLNGFHLSAYGDYTKTHQLKRQWNDLEMLRKLDLEEMKSVFRIVKLENCVTKVIVSQDPNRKVRSFKFALTRSYSTITDVKNLSRSLKECLVDDVMNDHTKLLARSDDMSQRCFQLRLCLLSGGIRLEDLVDIDEDLLGHYTSRAALLLYNANQFIRFQDIAAESELEIQNNILKWLARVYCHEEAPRVNNLDVLKLILDASDLFRTRTACVTKLVSESIAEVRRNLLSAYLTHYFQEVDHESFVAKIPDGDVTQYLNVLTKIIRKMSSYYNQSADGSMLAIRNYFRLNHYTGLLAMQLDPVSVRELCVLYQEKLSVDLFFKSGYVDIKLGLAKKFEDITEKNKLVSRP